MAAKFTIPGTGYIGAHISGTVLWRRQAVTSVRLVQKH